jgi:hypothetical protein
MEVPEKIEFAAQRLRQGHRVNRIADLTFGEYVRLLQHPQIWAKLKLKVDCGTLTALLEEVRVIRNDVMHFDSDPMTPDELGTLSRLFDSCKSSMNCWQRRQPSRHPQLCSPHHCSHHGNAATDGPSPRRCSARVALRTYRNAWLGELSIGTCCV